MLHQYLRGSIGDEGFLGYVREQFARFPRYGPSRLLRDHRDRRHRQARQGDGTSSMS